MHQRWTRNIAALAGRLTSMAAIVGLTFGASLVAHGEEVLPKPTPAFAGKIGRTVKDSTKDFPKATEAPKGAPNILVILTDDVGFGAASTFGGPVPTTTMDRLAQAGLRYNNFHTTALCSPTRAALLTGRNSHSVATGVIMEAGTGFPGYNTLQPKSAATFAEILKQNGYNTAWFGKNHNVPDWQSSQAGPFDLWPTGLGFEYFYGFIAADVNQWNPTLFEGTLPIEPPHAKDYHFDRDMADKTIERIRTLNAVAPDKPFVVYYAPGTSHAPHHAPKEWIAKFRGKFDQGWDKVREETFARQKAQGIIPADAQLTERSAGIDAWNSLDAEHKRVYARMMEVYAASLAHADYQMGRVIDAIDALGKLDNTLVIYIQGDNGASGEGGPQGLLNEMTWFNNVQEDFKEVSRRIDELGGPTTYNHYPVGWAHALNTPFQWTKQIASHFGGTRNGMVISWPARIKDKGGVRNQFHHVIDIMPTLLEATGVPVPASVNGVRQQAIEGVSMVYTFDNAAAPSTRKTQYFEMIGNRAIYQDGWIASTTPPSPPWSSLGTTLPVEDYKWELYNVKTDFSQSKNLAASEPQRLKEMQELFWSEAEKYNVLPLDNSKVQRLNVANRPSLTAGRTLFTYYPGMIRIPEGAAPDTKNRSYRLSAEIEVPKSGVEGMLLTQGGRFAGFALYLQEGKPVFTYNLAGIKHYTLEGEKPLSAGKHSIVFDFQYDGGGAGKGGTGTLLVDGEAVASQRFDRTLPFRYSLDETLDCGEDTGTAVIDTYRPPFRFEGTIKSAAIDIKPEPLKR